VGRLAALLATACALCASLAGAATAPTTAYRVVSMSSSARLVYGGETIRDREHIDGVTTVTARRASGKQASRGGTLGATGGRVTAKLTATTVETAMIRQRESNATPYVEQNCQNKISRKTSGGVILTRLSGARVRVGWSLPQANAVTCPGPSGVGRRLLTKMTRVYPASRFKAGRIVLALSGSAPFTRGPYEGTYTWRASLTLARLSG
jgi:hypothetical protein